MIPPSARGRGAGHFHPGGLQQCARSYDRSPCSRPCWLRCCWRGLLIEGNGAGLTGIRVNSAKSVTLSTTSVRGFTGIGMEAFSNISLQLFVSDSSFADNGGGGIHIETQGAGAATLGTMTRIASTGNGGIGLFM